MMNTPMLRPPFEWPIPTPELKDEHVILRNVSLADVDEIVANAVDPETTKYLHIPSAYTRADAEEFVKKSEVRWAYEDPTEVGRMAGIITLRPHHLGSHSISMSYNTHPWARGRGLTTGLCGSPPPVPLTPGWIGLWCSPGPPTRHRAGWRNSQGSCLRGSPGGPSCTGMPATTWPSMGYWPRTWCPRVSTTWPRGTSVWVWSTRFLTATRPASSSRSPSTRANRAPARSAPFMAPLRPRSP